MRTLLLDALRGKNRARPPVWLMRQAGRYLPAYRALKDRYGSDALFHDSELITAITLLPVQELDVDAAILFSDILILLDSLGISWKITEGIGPIIDSPFPCDFQKTEPQKAFQPLLKAIQELKRELQVPLIGFSGGPFTIASYLIEGKQPRALKKTKEWLFRDPPSFQKLLESLSESIVELLMLQIDAGVDAIQIFDTYASELSLREFNAFVLPSLSHILERISSKVPAIVFTKQSSMTAPLLAKLPCQGISVDGSVDIASLRDQIPRSIALQGNLDPSLFFAEEKVIEEHVNQLLTAMHDDPSFIVNLSHGILPNTSVDKVKCLVNCIRKST